MKIELEHLDEEACVVCGAAIKEVIGGYRHPSGECDEVVRYSCGRELHYSPNLKRVLEEVGCPNENAGVERRASVDNFYNVVLTAARDTECLDREYKKRILYWIETAGGK